jgi:hypothetical protein
MKLSNGEIWIASYNAKTCTKDLDCKPRISIIVEIKWDFLYIRNKWEIPLFGFLKFTFGRFFQITRGKRKVKFYF